MEALTSLVFQGRPLGNPPVDCQGVDPGTLWESHASDYHPKVVSGRFAPTPVWWRGGQGT
jgi:hypothetical protein